MNLRVPSALRPHKLNQFGVDHVLVAILCVVVVAIWGTVVIVASHAYTVHWKGLLEEGSGSSGFCLTTNGSANGSSVALDPCNSTGSNTQSWSLNYTGHATVLGTANVQEFTLQSSNGTTECLNDPNGSKTNGVQLQLYTCHSNDPNNLWVWGGSITGKGLAYHQLINVASSLCIDDAYGSHAAANKVQLWACKTSGQANQSWYEHAASSSSSGGTSSSSGCYAGSTPAPCLSGSGSGTGANGYGTPEFDDEFSGTSLNTSNWVAGRRGGGFGGYNPSVEQEEFSPNAVSVSDGDLALTATKQSDAGKPWTSGTVEAATSKNYTYGYFEARIEVPDPSAAWTAFWLTGQSNWPPELDIFEFHFCNSQPTFNNHGTVAGTNTNLPGWPCSTAYGGSSTDFTQWHTYGLSWTSSAIKVYFDGTLQSITTSSDGIPSTPMFPILDYAIDSGTNPPSGSQMKVDYLRIWK